MQARTLLFTAVLLLTPASGSLLEDTSGGLVEYQFDGPGFHDAPDDCTDANALHELPLGARLDGMLVPVDDEVDHWLLSVDAQTVGQRILVDAIPAPADYDIVVDVFVPGCTGSVLDPENQPEPPIQDPVPGDGEQAVQAKNLDGAYACSDRWFWNLNQLGGAVAPESIHVTWTDGSQEDVPLQKATPATVAHYATTAHPDVTVERATAVVADDWDGQFILSEGFCDAVDGGAVFGEDARRHGETALEFTPTQTGPYVVSIVYKAPEPNVPTSIPATCHACVNGADGAFDSFSYDLGSLLN